MPKRQRDPVAIEYGQRLGRARKLANLTQKEAGTRAGITEAQYRAYEKGWAKVPVELIPILATIFGTTVEALHGIPEPGGLSHEARMLAEWFDRTRNPNLRRLDIEFVRSNYELDQKCPPTEVDP